MDYFSACSATSICESKCRAGTDVAFQRLLLLTTTDILKNAEFKAFDHQLAIEAAAHIMDGNNAKSRTIQKTVESLLFADVNEDSYTPMNIMAMVELSECASICGGMYVEEKQEQSVQLGKGKMDDQNKDTCIAVAGLPSNNTIMVKKYCIPKAQVPTFAACKDV